MAAVGYVIEGSGFNRQGIWAPTLLVAITVTVISVIIVTIMDTIIVIAVQHPVRVSPRPLLDSTGQIPEDYVPDYRP